MSPPTDPTWTRWDEVDRLFAAALEQPAEDRERFVRDACGPDRELYEAVLALIRAMRESQGLFEAPDPRIGRGAMAELAERTEGRGATLPSEYVGPYHLLGELGRGGMGTVYLAERQSADLRQRVALKVLRRGIDTEDVVRRFLAERRILASLTHPNISRLLDGGTTEDGRPYLAMEHVEGRPITEHCDRAGLGVRERLQLFIEVAHAVSYAHANLVVHRDLKPSNIMVTPQGRVKLLDFGIAKLLEPDADNVLTRTGVQVLTPEYASPEQVRGEPITTVSDVYQLGVLLFVLLTGRRPYVVTGRSPAALSSIVQAVVPRPSTVVREAEGRGEIARVRGTTADRLQRTLRGDLDTIVLKALRKEPDRRYASAEQLADDVVRYLQQRPISARTDTLRYRSAKFLRRHTWVGPAVLAGLAFLMLYSWTLYHHAAAMEAERNVARAEAQRAEEVQRFLVDLFKSADPYTPVDSAQSSQMTVLNVLQKGTQRVRSELADRPAIKADLLGTIAEVYDDLGQSDPGLATEREALTLRRRLGDTTTAAYRAGVGHLGSLYWQAGQGDSALVMFRRRLDLALQANGQRDPEVASARVDLALHLVSGGRLAEARTQLQTVVADSATVAPAELSEAYRSLADIDSKQGRLEEGERLARRALALKRQVYGDSSPGAAVGHVTLAGILGGLGRLDEAEQHFDRGLKILKSTIGPDHDITLTTLNNLAILRMNAGNLTGAEEIYRQVLAAQVRRHGGTSLDVGTTYQNLGTVLARQGRLAEAERLHRHALAIYRQRLQPGSYLLALPHLSLSAIDLQQGQPAVAESEARAALAILEKTLPPGHYATAVARCRVGRALAAQGQPAAAEKMLVAAADVLRDNAVVPRYRSECLTALADLYRKQGRETEADSVREQLSRPPGGG